MQRTVHDNHTQNKSELTQVYLDLDANPSFLAALQTANLMKRPTKDLNSAKWIKRKP